MASKPSLEEYQRKRNLERSPEPKAKKKTSGTVRPIFVIQQHRASSMHFDFRLEVGGVLVSWAVPKGPSTDPKEKRLALMVEGHPLDYHHFEGRIPEGEYGAGTVIVWDTGHYRNLMEEKENALSMAESIEEGHVEVWLEGKKLQGGYVLIHTGKGKNKKQWLLKKMKDDKADARRSPVNTEPESVLSGKTVQELEEEMSGARGNPKT